MHKKVTLVSIVITLIILGCSKEPQKINQTTPSISPSGKYILTVPIERNSKNGNLPFWRITISDVNNKILYKDIDSEFIATLNVYWCWDKNDCIWLYNSDDSYVYFWELNKDAWKKQKWGHGKTKEITREIKPPDLLYPYYIK